MFRYGVLCKSVILVLVLALAGRADTVFQCDFDGSQVGDNTSLANMNAGTTIGSWTGSIPGQAHVRASGDNNGLLLDRRSGEVAVEAVLDEPVGLEGTRVSFKMLFRRTGANKDINIIGLDDTGAQIFHLFITSATSGSEMHGLTHVDAAGVETVIEGSGGTLAWNNDVYAPDNMAQVTLDLLESSYDVRGVSPRTDWTATGLAYASDATTLTRVLFLGDNLETGIWMDDIRVEGSSMGTDAARGPRPAGGTVDVVRDGLVLSWIPGDNAQRHDVYLGETAMDVNDATLGSDLLISENQDANSLALDRLEFGKTYYWRVDAIVDNAPTKGTVWNFTVEPYSILVPVDAIKVAASSSGAETPPSMLVNGSGLEGNTHSRDEGTMWLSAIPDPAPWLMFEFDTLQKLDQVEIWNANTRSEIAIGWGIKDVNIVTSVDGETWTTLGQPSQISQAPGLDTYSAPHVVDLNLTLAKYVRIDILSNWGGLLSQYGVSEVQFYGLPMVARTPDPASGSIVLPDRVAIWRAGREAATHDISASPDPHALIDGTASSVSAQTSELDLSVLDLTLGQTIYWRVDEVNDSVSPSVWQGPVWDFAVLPYLVVDDFDSYSNISPNRPFQTWLDGFGYSSDEFFPQSYGGNGTGSGIGHDIWSLSSPHYDGDIMEGSIAKSGSSMPLYFNNTNGLTLSEAGRTLTPAQDWTAYGIKSLTVNFHGGPDNSGQLYAKINGVRIEYDGLSDALQREQWIPWNIDLSGVSTDLSHVTSLAIGIDNAGATGVLTIDDIRLYPSAPETFEPVMPVANDPNLVALYEFEGNALDSAGDHHATVVGAPQYTDGKFGQAISFDGFVDYVVHAFDAEETWPFSTVSLWVKTDSLAQAGWLGLFNNNSSGSDFQFDVDGSDPGFYRYSGVGGTGLLGPVKNDWVHLAMTCDGTQTRIHYNGLFVMSIDVANTLYGQFAMGVSRNMTTTFAGQIDDVRVYNRALSDAEIAGLAGVTETVSTAF